VAQSSEILRYAQQFGTRRNAAVNMTVPPRADGPSSDNMEIDLDGEQEGAGTGPGADLYAARRIR